MDRRVDRFPMNLFRNFKKNILIVAIVLVLFLHVLFIHKVSIYTDINDNNNNNDEKRLSNSKTYQYSNDNNKQKRVLSSYAKALLDGMGIGVGGANLEKEYTMDELARIISWKPKDIVESENLMELPGICSEQTQDQIKQCEEDRYYKSVVTPNPVLDEKKMDYTLRPNSEHRAKFAYYPRDSPINAKVNDKPIITILTPYYNIKKEILDETARCIFRQSLQNFQWVIVNDGSPNKTVLKEALGPYLALNDSRITYVDLEQNQGLPGARNAGLKHSIGKYIVFLDPDDIMENTYLEKAVWFLETHPHYTLCNPWSLGFGHKEYLWPKGFQAGDFNLKENQLIVATVMKTEVLKQIGGLDAKLKEGMEDWDVWMRMADNGHWGYSLEETLFWYRVSPPGKWRSMDNITLYNQFYDNQKKKYPVAFSKGVPKLSRPEQQKMESVADEVTIINPLKKCRPRVLLILPHMELGGADQFNFNFAQGMVLDDWEVTIATTRKAPNNWLPQFLRTTPDIFIMPRFLKMTDQPRFLSYLIKSRDFDVVFLSNSEYGYHYLSYLRANAPGPAYVDYTHSGETFWKNGGYPRYSAGSEILLDRSILASDNLRQFTNGYGHNVNKTCTVLIGVDSDKYVPAPQNRALVRKEFGFPDDVLLIAFVARLDPLKQPHVFAEVLRRVVEKGYDIRALSMGDGHLLNEFNETLHKFNLQDKVKLLGSIPNTLVSKYVSASDVVFLPSLSEGISLAIYEGMSQGVCSVSAKVGGQAELITPDVGYLVVPGNPEEVDQYTNIISLLASNLTIPAEMGKRSREKILNGFSVRDTLEKLKEEFCNAAIVSKFSTKLFSNRLLAKVSNEMAVLAFEYERAEGELLPLWENYVKATKQCAPPPTVEKKEYKRLPSPYKSGLSPEEVLENLDLEALRVVDDIFEEKKLYDKKMKLSMHDYQDSFLRKNPKIIHTDYKYNDFLHRDNHGVSEWNNEIPFPYAQQEYVAYLSDVFVGTGTSGVIFDWDRVFLLRKPFNKVTYELPSKEYSKCQVVTHKKIATLVQIYFSYGNFIMDDLPKLSLIWDELQKDPEIKVMVPNTQYSRIIMEQLLKLPNHRVLYFNPGEGWDPCTIHFAETLLLPTPIVPDHVSKNQMSSLRDIIYKQNDLTPDKLPTSQHRNIVIYAGRSKALSSQRKMSNELEFIETLKSTLTELNNGLNGHQRDPYELIVWDGEEVLNQTVLEFASKAVMMIGITGSNLAPMIAAQPDTIIIELLHENPWLLWWATSQSLSHEHWMVPISGVSHESESILIPITETIETVKKSLENWQIN
ncbi:putative glycosyltransferase [Tieghemostelium lacteum]|uniref:Putative glycosyltransferase n=1 Tax=Tieghemostelium lacteum TaxID=361077 RepID=A0A152A6R7_TIELA|nr:putative glycosyltransferase [Tieghemostelium lacteum]|eukprot:KYR01815.1 putative glycosyltransferase [Tieghemostelium lacteum]